MAKEKMITRTIRTHTVTVMCVNTETHEVFNAEYRMGFIKDTDKMFQKLKKQEDTEKIKLVSIVGINTSEHLYEISENDFIKYGKIVK